MNKEEMKAIIDLAIDGDRNALEIVVIEINNFIFNISLRMLGNINDAEDVTQDILMKILSKLSTFNNKSSFKTWVYRITVNFLLDYKRNLDYSLNFDSFANDLKISQVESEKSSNNDLENELKLSCTNIMLQCLSPKARCIFILGTIFKVDSITASEILNIRPENYRQILSRSRKKVGNFLAQYCEHAGGEICSCNRRVNYAISKSRLNTKNLEYTSLEVLDLKLLEDYKEHIEILDDFNLIYEELPQYKSKLLVKEFLEKLVNSTHMKLIESYN